MQLLHRQDRQRPIIQLHSATVLRRDRQNGEPRMQPAESPSSASAPATAAEVRQDVTALGRAYSEFFASHPGDVLATAVGRDIRAIQSALSAAVCGRPRPRG